jgi:acylphosphatase
MSDPGALGKTVHVRIVGRVQGVGFRAWTEMEATALGLTGWVRNRFDGAVEAVFHGDDDAVGVMLRLCHSGPPGARVDVVEVLGEGVGVFDGFDVLPTV